MFKKAAALNSERLADWGDWLGSSHDEVDVVLVLATAAPCWGGGLCGRRDDGDGG